MLNEVSEGIAAWTDPRLKGRPDIQASRCPVLQNRSGVRVRGWEHLKQGKSPTSFSKPTFLALRLKALDVGIHRRFHKPKIA
jgi:hypothetical protein